MIKEIRVINYNEGVATGTSYFTLTRPEESGFAIVNIDGLAPEDVQLSKTDYSFSDGTHFNQARLSSKEITISFVFQPRYELEETIEFKRHELYDIFRIKDTVRLIIITDDLELYIDGYVTSNKPEIFSEMEGAEVRLDCMDPYFKSETEDVFEFNSMIDEGTIDGFEFPFENILEFGERGGEKHLTMAYFPETESIYYVTIPVQKRSQINNGIHIKLLFNSLVLNVSRNSIKNKEISISKWVSGNKVGDSLVFKIGQLLYDSYDGIDIIYWSTLISLDIITIDGKKDIVLTTNSGALPPRLIVRRNLFNYLKMDDGVNWFNINDGDCEFHISTLLYNNVDLIGTYSIYVERLYSGV